MKFILFTSMLISSTVFAVEGSTLKFEGQFVKDGAMPLIRVRGQAATEMYNMIPQENSGSDARGEFRKADEGRTICYKDLSVASGPYCAVYLPLTNK